MAEDSNSPTRAPFPSIKTDMLDRLSDEAEQRTIKPETVDWAEIHRQAAEARDKD